MELMANGQLCYEDACVTIKKLKFQHQLRAAILVHFPDVRDWDELEEAHPKALSEAAFNILTRQYMAVCKKLTRVAPSSQKQSRQHKASGPS